MSDLVGNPEDRFSHDTAHMVLYFQMRLFEKTKPLETEVEQLRLKVKTLESSDKTQSKQLLDLQEVYNIYEGCPRMS